MQKRENIMWDQVLDANNVIVYILLKEKLNGKIILYYHEGFNIKFIQSFCALYRSSGSTQHSFTWK